MRKIFAICACMCMFLLMGLLDRNIQIQTNTEPIYNHFPTFPYTEKMEWYSTSSDGIGLSVKNIYVFAYYDTAAELDRFLESASLSWEAGDIGAIVVPESAAQNDTWRQVTDLPFAFQDGIPKAKLLNTEVYVNSDHTMLYMHAMGE